MAVGTTLTNYETVRLPESIVERYGSPAPLTSTIGMLTLSSDIIINDRYKLAVSLIAEVKIENGKYVVFDYQVEEYGIGNSLSEAQQDLLDSLVDYLASLEKRENRLGDRERLNLQGLRTILARR